MLTRPGAGTFTSLIFCDIINLLGPGPSAEHIIPNIFESGGQFSKMILYFKIGSSVFLRVRAHLYNLAVTYEIFTEESGSDF